METRRFGGVYIENKNFYLQPTVGAPALLALLPGFSQGAHSRSVWYQVATGTVSSLGPQYSVSSFPSSPGELMTSPLVCRAKVQG